MTTLLAISFSVYLLLITVKYHDAVKCGLNPVSCPPETKKYRTFDGTCNNLNDPGMGSMNIPYNRWIEPPNYFDGVSEKPRSVTGEHLPNERYISEQTVKHIPDVGSSKVRLIGGYHQFIAHDHSFTVSRSFSACCTPDMKPLANTPSSCENIVIPVNDSYYSQFKATCMPKTKTTTTHDMNCTGSTPKPYADQISGVPPSLDLNIVYGNSKSECDELREFKNGRMKMRNIANAEYLPLKQGCAIPANSPNICYKAGDVRANQNLDLIINHIIWTRFHNWCCDQMQPINPHWNDERLFQECRKLNIAVHQYLAFSEVFPAVIGYKAMFDRNLLYPYKLFSKRSKYDANCELNPLNEFSNGAYRILHAIIIACLQMANEKRESLGDLKFSDHLNNPSIIEGNDTFDHLIRGGTCQRAAKVGPSFDSDITSRLRFNVSPFKFGIDLHAMDIARSREHGIPSYNTIRAKCGLKNATTFNDFLDAITKTRIEKLASIYKHPHDVDYIVGGTFETPLSGTLVGPSVACVFVEALERMQKCDRYWFDNDQKHFTDLQVDSIRLMSVASLLCLTGDSIEYMQSNALEPPSLLNPLLSCLFLPPMPLIAFKENVFP